MMSRVGSKLRTGAAILIGGTVGHQLKKHHEALHHIPDKSQKSDYKNSVLSHQKKNGKTISNIFHSLEEFASSSASRNPVAESYAENAKLLCQRYLVHERLEVGGPEVWLAEWLAGADWVDTVDYWPPPPSRFALAPPSYTAALSCGVRALWYISCCRDFCKGNSVFTYDLVKALKRVIEDGGTKVTPMALKVVANLAVHPEHHHLIHDTGLVDVLTTCADHHHPYIFLPAWRGLHNLKAGGTTSKCTDVFIEGIYPFVLAEEDEMPLVDIVLVHGIEGGAPWTWRQRDADIDRPPLPQSLRRKIKSFKEEVDQYSTCCWPLDWLAPSLDLPVRVLALDFQACWWRWGCDFQAENAGKSLPSHSQEMRQALVAAGLGERPIMWITHSMGGLLTKHILMEDQQGTASHGGSSEELYLPKKSGGSLARQTTAIVFCSVPHHGSSLATAITTWPLTLLLQPTREIWEMRTDNPLLEVIHKSFLSLVKEQQVAVLSLLESEPTQHRMLWWDLHFVVPHLADPGVGEFCEVETTHRDICKPVDRKADIYQKILYFLKETLDHM